MLDIVPGIFEKEYAEIVRKVGLISPYAQWLHIDVADETLVASRSFLEFDKWQDMPGHLSFEAHLMVASPEKYIRPLVKAGFSRLVAHVEANDPREFLAVAKHEEVEIVLGLDGPSELELVEPFLDEIDGVLIMTVEMGASGMPFLPETVEKIKAIHRNYPDLVIEVDGGITDQTAKLVAEAGATRLSATNYIWDHTSDLSAIIARLKQP